MLTSGTAVELVHPDDATAGLVVVPDIMGLRPLFDDLVAHLADSTGWAVAAFEVFPGQESMAVEERLAAMPTMPDERWVTDAVATANLLDVEGPIGILGFCMGGMVTLKAAATGRFHRAVPFYGMIRNPADWGGGQGPNGDAMDAVAGSAGTAERVLAIVGTADPYTPAEHVDELEAAGATVVRYEGAEHGFVHDASRPAHRADDAADAWRRAMEWLTPQPLGR
jgi:carboxymethylenebutenolidase